MGHPHTGRPRVARRPAAAFLHRPRSFTKRRPPAWPSACPRRTFAPSRGVSGQVLQQLLSPPPVHRSVRREKTDFVWPVSSASWDKPVFRKHIPIGASCPHFRNQGFEGSAPPDAAQCLKRFFPPARLGHFPPLRRLLLPRPHRDRSRSRAQIRRSLHSLVLRQHS